MIRREEFRIVAAELEKEADSLAPVLVKIQNQSMAITPNLNQPSPLKNAWNNATLRPQKPTFKKLTLSVEDEHQFNLLLTVIGTGIGANVGHSLSHSGWMMLGSAALGGALGFGGFRAGLKCIPHAAVAYANFCELANRVLTQSDLKTRLRDTYFDRLKKNGVLLPEQNPELYIQHLLEGGIAQAYSLLSRKNALTEIERLEKALSEVESLLRAKGRTDYLEEIVALRQELRKKPSLLDSKEKLFTLTQQIRQRYTELAAKYETHGTRGMPALESVLYPDPQRTFSEISLDFAMIKPANPKNAADVAAAKELYAQSLTTNLSEILAPARKEGAAFIISRNALTGKATFTLYSFKIFEKPIKVEVTEKNLSNLPKLLQSRLHELAQIQKWEIQSDPLCAAPMATALKAAQKL